MGSTRLPGKVMADLAGRPVLAHVLARAGRIAAVSEVALAIPDGDSDDALAEMARASGVTVIRGSATDVLARYHHAADATAADAVVRITADCPLLDPHVSGAVVARFLDGGVDYVSNIDPPTYPDGYDTEVVARTALDEAWRAARDAYDREHVTPFIRRHRERFRAANVADAIDRSGWRLTLDTAADLERLRRLVAVAGPDAGLAEVAAAASRDRTLIEDSP